MVTFHSTVTDSLDLVMHIYGKLLGSVDTIICGVAMHWYYCTPGTPLKLKLRHDGLFRCKLDLMMYTDLSRGCITEYSAYIVDFRGDFG